jgi:hypothetical protein
MLQLWRAVEIRAKGMTFSLLLANLERLRGRDAVDATYKELPPEVESALRLGEIVSNGWYPIEWYRALHSAMNRACDEKGVELSYRIGRESSISQFRGMHRLLLRVLSSEMLVSQSPKIFRMYFDGGEVVMSDVSTGLGTIEFSAWHGFDRAIWSGIMGGLEGFLVARRAFDIRHRVIRGGGSDGSLKVEWRWSMDANVAATDRRGT